MEEEEEKFLTENRVCGTIDKDFCVVRRTPTMKRNHLLRRTALMLAVCLTGTLCACGTSADTHTREEESVTMETEAMLPTVTVTEQTEDLGYDFVIDIPAGRDIKILQLSDLQTMEMDGVRNENRYHQIGNAFFGDNVHDQQIQTWRYVEEAIARSNPDLIVLAGDIIYGQTDDDGSQWLEVCEKMDSYAIPWLVIFGNHDNESAKGVLWQIEQVRSSEYGILKQGSVTGNSNYSVGLRQDGMFKYTLYMMDTNGCHTYPNNPGEGMMDDNPDIALITQQAGIYPDQRAWIHQTGKYIAEQYGDVPALVFMHIPITEAATAARRQYKETYQSYPFTPDLAGDTGVSYEAFVGLDTGGAFWDLAKMHGVTGMFFAHQHNIAASIVWDGIRLSYGLKTSTHDYHLPELLGSLAITLGEDDGALSVDYQYTALPYQESGETVTY